MALNRIASPSGQAPLFASAVSRVWLPRAGAPLGSGPTTQPINDAAHVLARFLPS